MTDQELIEFAAKAVGIKGTWQRDTNFIQERYQFEIPYSNQNMMTGVVWNPLNDDGDAFRLAAKLGIDVIWNKAPNSSYNEYLTIARRAIVKAAAKIGQNQQQTC